MAQSSVNFPINYGLATIPYGMACTPRQGKDADRKLPAGWRLPNGEITQDKAVALEWAKDIDDYLLRRGWVEDMRRAA